MKSEEKRQIGAKSLPLSRLSPKKSSPKNPNPHGRNGIKISFAPLSFDDALRKILKAEPPPKEPKQTKRKAKKPDAKS